MTELTQSALRDVLSYDAETGEFVWLKSRAAASARYEAARAELHSGYVEGGA